MHHFANFIFFLCYTVHQIAFGVQFLRPPLGGALGSRLCCPYSGNGHSLHECVTSEEGLWVEKSRQPDNTGQRQVLSPAVQLFTALQHIIVPDTDTDRKMIECLVCVKIAQLLDM